MRTALPVSILLIAASAEHIDAVIGRIEHGNVAVWMSDAPNPRPTR